MKQQQESDDSPLADDPATLEGSLGWALCFEAGLGLLALLIGHLTIVWPATGLRIFGLGYLAIGVLSAVPPLIIMISLRRVSWAPLRGLNDLVDNKLMPMFRGLSMVDLAILSFAAGWGEELLFRGLIQAEIAYHTSFGIGLITASLVFALLHFLSPAYFVLAFVVSLYFGWLYWVTGSLWVPILGHAVYDFAMLAFLQRQDEQRSIESAPELRLFDGPDEDDEFREAK